MSPENGGTSNGIACRQCGTPLAHDQRYCVQCGARRAGLPSHVAGLFAGIVERGRRVATPARPEGEPLVVHPHWYDAWVQAPRAAAVAVLSMLGFGVVVGSLVTGSAASVLGPVVVAVSPSSQSVNQAGQSAGGGAGGGGGGGVQTITVTQGGGNTNSSGGGGGSGGGSSGGGGGTTTTGLSPTGNAPPIKHVFMVMLSDQGFNATFGHSGDDPYLAKTLVKQGELVQNYYAVAGGPLANEVALVSGQGPTPNTVNNCPQYTDVVPADSGSQGQILGTGCVYPSSAQTLADQVTAAGQQWKAYVQTPSTGKTAQLEACRHPKIGAHDRTEPAANDPYLTWRNPFLYFQSTLGTSKCPKEDVPISQLATDLKSATSTPALSYIVANPCNDGSDTPCKPHAKAGPLAADAFLKSVIPQIVKSPAYKADGLIAITYDQAPQTGPNADSSSCCGNPTNYPNLIGFGTGTGASGSTGPSGPSGTTGPSSSGLGNGQTNPTGGGGQVGLLLLSKYVQPGVPEVTDYYNHFSLLAGIEDSFGFKHLGYASVKSLPLFGAAVWTGYGGGGF